MHQTLWFSQIWRTTWKILVDKHRRIGPLLWHYVLTYICTTSTSGDNVALEEKVQKMLMAGFFLLQFFFLINFFLLQLPPSMGDKEPTPHIYELWRLIIVNFCHRHSVFLFLCHSVSLSGSMWLRAVDLHNLIALWCREQREKTAEIKKLTNKT